jgi:hypothetical protein
MRTTRGGGGGPILIPMETWANTNPPVSNINAINLFFTVMASLNGRRIRL